MTKINPKVVDLSHYDDVTDWNAVKAFGIVGVVNKATEGPGMVDKTFAVRRAPVQQRGMHYAAYHFLRPGSVTAQVGHFLEVALATANANEIGLALDHEDPQVPLANARAFCECLKDRVGRYPWLYSGFLIKQQLGDVVDPFWAQVPLWLSHYSANPKWPRCWPKPFLWQFTGDGVGPGPHNVPGIHIDGDGIDINSFDGSDAELAATWIGGQPSAPVKIPTAPVNKPPVGRQTDIIATCFGGADDTNASAYGGMVDPSKPGVALPARVPSPRPKVLVHRGGASVVCDVVDVGPHNTHDPYWVGGGRPQAEDQGGNKAGIDLTPAVFAELRITTSDPEYGLTKVDWEFAP